MSNEWKSEARKQYFHYFRGWFIAVGMILAVTIAVGVMHLRKAPLLRANTSAPAERVYDNAGILTDAEEDKLRRYIARMEAKYGADFVILTFSEPVEGPEAEYRYSSANWETNMINIADDFWDENGYGYNKNFEGDGSILIDNRYEGQRGEWLSTSGKVEDALGSGEVESVLYAVDRYYDSDPCRAYMSYIDKVCGYLDGGFRVGGFYYLGALAVSLITAGVYAASHLGKNKVRDTTPVNAYVVGGRPKMRNKTDDFIRKNVVTRRIETGSGSGGGGRSSGGGGHHVSRSGASHGGGGHRH